jgi:RimJ/RimL family protein N-acetyltransferase
MSDIIKEIGINTLKEYRNQGLAKDSCTCAIREIIKQGKIPIWSTDASNIPSQKLAESLGFEKWGESISVALN